MLSGLHHRPALRIPIPYKRRNTHASRPVACAQRQTRVHVNKHGANARLFVANSKEKKDNSRKQHRNGDKKKVNVE